MEYGRKALRSDLPKRLIRTFDPVKQGVRYGLSPLTDLSWNERAKVSFKQGGTAGNLVPDKFLVRDFLFIF